MVTLLQGSVGSVGWQGQFLLTGAQLCPAVRAVDAVVDSQPQTESCNCRGYDYQKRNGLSPSALPRGLNPKVDDLMEQEERKEDPKVLLDQLLSWA